ncbi:MAG: hypothetical protein GC186_16600 [Rhodobacteraceae bacterium]|nr:hypothetical protein [Paracoccaceae bacterium]
MSRTLQRSPAPRLGRPPRYGSALRKWARRANGPDRLTGAIGLIVFLLAFVFWPKGIVARSDGELVLFLALVTLPMILFEIAVARAWAQSDAGLDFTLSGLMDRLDLRVLAEKTTGVLATVAGIAAIYLFVPLYQDPWYQATLRPVLNNGILLTFVLWAYVMVLHFVSKDPRDGWAEAGRFVLSRGAEGDRAAVFDHTGATLIKVFYIPLMFGFARDDWGFFYANALPLNSFREVYEFLYRFLFFIDVVFGTIGYVVSLRILNAHIRWPEQKLSGWLVCLVCYAPFWQVIGRDFLQYDSSITWGSLFPENSLTYDIWGTIILLLIAAYASSTVAFAFRFSNLTYRGTVCHGTYAYVRHPAYLSKNLSYWLIQVPFLAASPRDAIANTLALIAVNLLYYARARHEEACCGAHRDYRIYARYLRRFSPVSRACKAAKELIL